MKKFLTILSAILVAAEFALLVVSWLLSAMMTAGSVRSLFSGEGIRWLLGRFVETLQTPVLVWLLLLSMAYGCVCACGCLSPPVNRRRNRRLTPLRGASFVVLLAVVLIVLLFVQPQAVLLSATGSLWPSPFSRALVPLIALLAMMFAVCYGVLARTFTSLDDVFRSFAAGIASAAPLFVVYVFVVQFVASLRFVLGG